uniref:PPPDE domain-containing protein n=1 Tax=Arion vulgaris TaxID=1028688 RepID=A0A0B7AU60_9EUPU
MADESFPVKVYVYDISMGMARALSQGILGRQLDGIWHTGIVVYGQEYFFGGTDGIEACGPGGTILGQPTQIVDLGKTEIPFDVFMEFLQELSDTTYRPEKYHLFHHNCNNFTSELAQFLTGKDIPSHITSLPQEVLSTPFGAMIQPFVDAMHVQGGHSPFQ